MCFLLSHSELSLMPLPKCAIRCLSGAGSHPGPLIETIFTVPEYCPGSYSILLPVPSL